MRDAADVVTLTWGLGAGVQPRVGPLTTGLMANAEFGGLRGGVLGAYGGEVNHWFVGVLGGQRWPVVGDTPRRRGKAMPWLVEQAAWWPYELEGPKAESIGVAASYFTDLELQVGVGISVRAGFNPLEMVDFLLGFVGVDLFADDLGEPVEAGADAGCERVRRVLNLGSFGPG